MKKISHNILIVSKPSNAQEKSFPKMQKAGENLASYNLLTHGIRVSTLTSELIAHHTIKCATAQLKLGHCLVAVGSAEVIADQLVIFE